MNIKEKQSLLVFAITILTSVVFMNYGFLINDRLFIGIGIGLFIASFGIEVYFMSI